MDFTIRNIFKGVSHVMSQHWRLYLSALTIPFILMFASNYIFDQFDDDWFFTPTTLVTIIFQGLIALITHRITLNPQSVPELGLSAFGSRESYFFVYFVGTSSAFFAVSLVLIFFELLAIFFIFLVLSIWLFSRISLCFPAIAIGDYVGLKESWELTRSHQGTMLMVVLFFPLLVSLLVLPISLFVPLTEYVLEPIATVFTIIALSLAYAQIRTENDRD